MSLRKKRFVTLPLMAITAVTCTSPTPGRPSRSYPRFVRLSLAGASVNDRGSSVKYDPRERYFLLATGDCDGASIDLVLTPDLSAWNRRLEASTPRVSLPRLRTGRGVNIGDTPQEVRMKLGRSPHFYSYDSERRARVYEYRAKLGHGWLYSGEYAFRNERLWSIHYNVAHEDGC